MTLEHAREMMAMEGAADDMGVVLEDLGEGWSRGYLDIQRRHCNPTGSVCGSVLYSIADVLAVFAVASYGGGGSTVHGSINYLRPATGKRITCETNVVKAGKTLVYTHSSLRCTDGGESGGAVGTSGIDKPGKEVASVDLIYLRTEMLGPGKPYAGTDPAVG